METFFFVNMTQNNTLNVYYGIMLKQADKRFGLNCRGKTGFGVGIPPQFRQVWGYLHISCQHLISSLGDTPVEINILDGM